MKKGVLEHLQAMGINTNSILGTGSAGLGTELVPEEVFQKEIFDAIPGYGTFLSELPGDHNKAQGRLLNKNEVLPIVGEVGFFNGKDEKTSGPFALAEGTNSMNTGEIKIAQQKLYMTLDVTEELQTFSPTDFEAKMKEKIGKAAARTVESLIINGDPETGATGNINLDDAAPAAASYYLRAANSIRLAALATGVNVDAMTTADFITIQNLLGDYAASQEDCLWLFNRATYNKALLLTAFANSAERGEKSTVSGKAITNIFGSDVFIPRDLTKTEADGKISTTASNNVKGQIAYIWKPAIQYGYGKTMTLKLMDMGVDGYQLQAWFHFGFNIVDRKAGVTDQSVATGINIAL